MLKIVSVNGIPFALPGNDIDTDRIIPARFLKCVTFEGLGDHAFEDDRKQLGGRHPFDNPDNQERSILLVDDNFGCGSSREHAVPAIAQRGIKAIIGLSFAAIFSGNAVGNGLVCVTITKKHHAELSSKIAEVTGIEIDLDTMMIAVSHPEGGFSIPCEMPGSYRENLMTGSWDDIATCLEAGEGIEAVAAGLPHFVPEAAVA